QIGKEIGRPGLGLNEEALQILERADWPGNIRALRNALERASILADRGTALLGPEHLWLDPTNAPEGEPDHVLSQPLSELERAAIERALAESQGNRRQAAEKLGIGLRTLYDKLKRYGVKR